MFTYRSAMKCCVLLVFAGLISSSTGCIALPADGCGSRVFNKHPRVRWVFGPQHRFEWFGPVGLLTREGFTDAGMFGNSIVLHCASQGDMARPIQEHTYILGTETGKRVFTLSAPWQYPLEWYVQSGQLVIWRSMYGSRTTGKRAYDLNTGRRVAVPGNAEHDPSMLKPVTVPETGPGLRVGQISERASLVERSPPEGKTYELFLDEKTADNHLRRSKLLEMERRGGGVRWAGQLPAGGYIIVLRDVALGVEGLPGDADSRP